MAHIKIQTFFVVVVLLLASSVCFAQEDTLKQKRFTLGGYGEAVMSRMFYSDNYKRYSNAELYKDAKGFGQFDLPHVVIYMGYDFGRGWTMGMEIEYEHGVFQQRRDHKLLHQHVAGRRHPEGAPPNLRAVPRSCERRAWGECDMEHNQCHPFRPQIPLS